MTPIIIARISTMLGSRALPERAKEKGPEFGWEK